MKKPKKTRTPFALRLIRWAFPKIEKLSPLLAGRWFVRIFFSTLQYRIPAEEQRLLDLAHSYTLSYNGRKVRIYEWGEGKPVLFVHGWMGRGAQFKRFIPAFVNAGYKAVTFDATGHGHSEGKSSHLMDFVGIIDELSTRYRQFEVITGHSLGGIAAFHASLKNQAKKLIMVNSPTSGAYILATFRQKIGASEKMGAYFNTHIQQTYGRSFESYSVAYNFDRLTDTELLLIHDEKDKEVAIRNSYDIAERDDRVKLITTSGLGHTRILNNQNIVDQSLKFTMEKVETYLDEPVSAC